MEPTIPQPHQAVCPTSWKKVVNQIGGSKKFRLFIHIFCYEFLKLCFVASIRFLLHSREASSAPVRRTGDDPVDHSPPQIKIRTREFAGQKTSQMLLIQVRRWQDIEPQRIHPSFPSDRLKVARQRGSISDVLAPPLPLLIHVCTSRWPLQREANERRFPPSMSSMLVVLVSPHNGEKGNIPTNIPKCSREASDLRKCGTIIHPGMMCTIAKSRPAAMMRV
jgi:hypothetical protein